MEKKILSGTGKGLHVNSSLHSTNAYMSGSSVTARMANG